MSQSANGTCPPARGGFHGWTKPKLQALLAHAPRILHELHALFARTVGTSKFWLPEELRSAIFAWRTVGIPKGDPGDSRLIRIASLLIRVWHRTLLDALPLVPAGQYCEIGVIPAVADFLAHSDGQHSVDCE